MRVRASELAQRLGVTDRYIRHRLAKGKFKGFKEFDPEVGAEVWWVELPDPPEESDPDQNQDQIPDLAVDDGPPTTSGGRQEGEADPDLGGSPWQLVDKLYRDNLELAGRLGFYQAKIQELETSQTKLLERIALLEAPKQQPPASKPWWKLW